MGSGPHLASCCFHVIIGSFLPPLSVLSHSRHRSLGNHFHRRLRHILLLTRSSHRSVGLCMLGVSRAVRATSCSSECCPRLERKLSSENRGHSSGVAQSAVASSRSVFAQRPVSMYRAGCVAQLRRTAPSSRAAFLANWHVFSALLSGAPGS